MTKGSPGVSQMADRVSWSVGCHSELYRIEGEKIGGHWVFWEKSSYENAWYLLDATPKLIAKAEQLLEQAIGKPQDIEVRC